MSQEKVNLKVLRGGRYRKSTKRNVNNKRVTNSGSGSGMRGRDSGFPRPSKTSYVMVCIVMLFSLVGVLSWVMDSNDRDVTKVTTEDRVLRTLRNDFGLSEDVKVVSPPASVVSKDIELTGTWYVSDGGKMYVYMKDIQTEKHVLYEMGEEVKKKIK